MSYIEGSREKRIFATLVLAGVLVVGLVFVKTAPTLIIWAPDLKPEDSLLHIANWDSKKVFALVLAILAVVFGLWASHFLRTKARRQEADIFQKFAYNACALGLAIESVVVGGVVVGFLSMQYIS